MNNIVLRVFTLLLTFCVYPQSSIKKTVTNTGITSINIDGTNCYKVQLQTKETKEILIEASIEGEYKKDLLISVKEELPFVSISAGFQPNFIKPNDKLSAHKVVSIFLKITLPRDLEVFFKGSNTAFTGSGGYKNLKIQLHDGTCNLNKTSGNVTVSTQTGDIFVQNTTGVFTLKSKYGTVNKDDVSEGYSKFNLSTNTGNIEVKKMK